MRRERGRGRFCPRPEHIMTNPTGFDNQKYLETQSARIQERIAQFGGKLYLEFGGKLFDDNHAARVLPGFASDIKLQMLLTLRESVEMLVVINASAIEQNKLRGDLGIPYDEDVLRLIDTFRGHGLYVGSVTITQYAGQPAADAFRRRLEHLGVTVYLHYPIPGYPHDVGRIVSEEGFGRNDYIETTRPLVVVTAPGPGSGKMATCLSQLYHHHQRGVRAGYAKFETFPIWNLPLKHPVNLAYEAATADLNDVNMIDPFHLQAYGETTVNYNRDVEVFPVLQAMGESPYRSPTDMGVNMAGHCITDGEAVCAAARQEIVRRYYTALCDRRRGQGNDEIVYKLELLMKQAHAGPELRPVIAAAEGRDEAAGEPAAAIRLPDGRVITGGTSELMGAAAAALLNALKALAGIGHEVHLIDRAAIEPIQGLKVGYLGSRNPRLHSDEVLIALAISTAAVPMAAQALESLGRLRQCEAHSSVILTAADSATYSKLGLRLTCTPKYQSNQQLYHK